MLRLDFKAPYITLYMRKIVLLVVLFTVVSCPTFAQDFLHLPPVVTTSNFKDTSVSFLLSTFDMRRFKGNQSQQYCNTVEILDASSPWPPRWYTTAPLYTDSMYQVDTINHLWRLYFVFDPKVDNGQLSFFKELTLTKIGEEKAASEAGYIILNKQMEPVDTARSTGKSAMYYHDFRTNSKHERLVDIKMDTVLDLRKASGEEKDSTVRSKIDIIQILDVNNKVIFSWNPLDHLDPNIFQFKESLKSRSFSASDKELIEWSRLTSAFFDYDGDILYSMRFVGIGKLSRKDGHVIWHIDFKDIPIIDGKDTIRWYSVHDFNLLKDDDTSATYSIYSLGDETFPHAGGVIFKMNKTTHQVSLVRNIYARRQYIGLGQGSCDLLDNGDYILNYGLFPEEDSDAEYRTFTEYGNKKDSIIASYQMPKLVYAYKVHKLEDWPRPPRPKITLKGGSLHVEGPMEGGWTWYRLDGPHKNLITEIGTGDSFKLRYSGTYCVEGKYGMGYSVSLPFEYKIKEKNEPY